MVKYKKSVRRGRSHGRTSRRGRSHGRTSRRGRSQRGGGSINGWNPSVGGEGGKKLYK